MEVIYTFGLLNSNYLCCTNTLKNWLSQFYSLSNILVGNPQDTITIIVENAAFFHKVHNYSEIIMNYPKRSLKIRERGEFILSFALFLKIIFGSDDELANNARSF